MLHEGDFKFQDPNLETRYNEEELWLQVMEFLRKEFARDNLLKSKKKCPHSCLLLAWDRRLACVLAIAELGGVMISFVALYGLGVMLTLVAAMAFLCFLGGSL